MNKKSSDLYALFFEEFIPTILEGTKNGGGRWPMPIFEQSFSVSNFSAPVIIKEFMAEVTRQEAEGVSDQGIGNKYLYPSRFARLQHMFVSRSLWLNSIDPVSVANKFASILSTMYKANVFCKEGKNLFYTQEEIAHKYPEVLGEKTKENLNLAIKKLDRILYLLSETYSPRFPNTHFEYSGPYLVAGKWIVVKEYHDLRPKVIPIKYHYNFDRLSIINIFDRNIDFSVDMMCRTKQSNQNLPTPVTSLLFVDGCLDENEESIERYAKEIRQSMHEAVEHLSGLVTKEQILKFNIGLEALTFLTPLKQFDLKALADETIKNFRDSTFLEKNEKFEDWTRAIPKDEAGWRTIFDARIKQGI